MPPRVVFIAAHGGPPAGVGERGLPHRDRGSGPFSWTTRRTPRIDAGGSGGAFACPWSDRAFRSPQRGAAGGRAALLGSRPGSISLALGLRAHARRSRLRPAAGPPARAPGGRTGAPPPAGMAPPPSPPRPTPPTP